MRTLIIALVSVALQAHADTVQVDFTDRSIVYEGCTISKDSTGSFGAYCAKEIVTAGGVPTDTSANTHPANVSIFSFDNSFFFIDETGECVAVTDRLYQCMNYILNVD